MLLTSIVSGNEKDGESLFLEHCSECHGAKGDGQGPVGPYLEEQRPGNLSSPLTRVKSNQELFEAIKFGVYLEMPSWEGTLSDQQIWSLIEHIRTFSAQSSSPSKQISQ